jgi:glutamine amidotransferase
MKTYILDYGTTNVTPLARSMRVAGFEVEVRNLSNIESIDARDLLILPGIGKWDYSMEELLQNALTRQIVSRAEGGGKILGICLGMQLMSLGSQEGNMSGLGIIKCNVKRIDEIDDESPRVNNGWHQISTSNKFFERSKLSDEVKYNSSKYYFSHSFAYSSEEMFGSHPEFSIFVPNNR